MKRAGMPRPRVWVLWLAVPWRAGETCWRSVYRPGVLACFWDSRNSGVMQPQGAGPGCDDVTPLTTDQMRQAASFRDRGWDFADVWMMRSGQSHPRLRWEQTP